MKPTKRLTAKRLLLAQSYLEAMLFGTFDEELQKRMGDKRDIPLWACDMICDSKRLIFEFVSQLRKEGYVK